MKSEAIGRDFFLCYGVGEGSNGSRSTCIDPDMSLRRLEDTLACIDAFSIIAIRMNDNPEGCDVLLGVVADGRETSSPSVVSTRCSR